MSAGVQESDPLALEPAGDDTFVSQETPPGPHVFGGLLLAQGLRAASTTTGRPPASLHASYVVAGAGGEPVTYEVERTRDGSSFTTRRVVARQSHGVLVVMTVDFHDPEEGPEYEAPAISGPPPGPDQLNPGRYDSPLFESYDVPPSGQPPHARLAWFRARHPVDPGDTAAHQQWLTMLTDLGPTRAAREPHAHLADDTRRMSVSLDHSIWYHRLARVDQWLVSEIVPVSTGGGRGLAIGTVRDERGSLLATFGQETLLRERR